jgi:hypothetical protein
VAAISSTRLEVASNVRALGTEEVSDVLCKRWSC